MARGDLEFRHIIDVDGQLIGIEARSVPGATILARAGHEQDRTLFLVRAGSQSHIRAHDLVWLTEDEVLFFETSASAWMPFRTLIPAVLGLAA